MDFCLTGHKSVWPIGGLFLCQFLEQIYLDCHNVIEGYYRMFVLELKCVAMTVHLQRTENNTVTLLFMGEGLVCNAF